MSWQFPKYICSFLRRHRNKFIFTGVFIGGVIGSLKFAEYKIKQYLEDEQKKTLVNRKRQRSLEQVHVHSVSLTQSMLQSIMNEVIKAANTEVITEKLKTSHENKIGLWNELKVTIFTRIVSGIFSVVAVIVVLRVQFLQLAAAMANNGSKLSDDEQKQILATCHDHLMETGIDKLSKILSNTTQTVTESMPLQCLVTHRSILTTLQSITSRLMVKDGPTNSFRVTDFTFSEHVLDKVNDTNIRSSILQTLDILDSPDCERVFVQCVAKGIDLLGSQMCDAMSSASSSDSVEMNLLPLAKCLPLLNSQLKYICSAQFVQQVSESPLLARFSNNVFDSFEDNL
uniref:Peroxisomal biogenesis factor 3 n=1 Tax=Phallusia mammillata TaxID=59560 RepID=A0A6F9DFQ0_9ASCI|nr:uncharacterized protein LOC100175349 [Phallusia mammillata]